MDSNFRYVTKTDLDREILKLTMSLYNNPLMSNKAVDESVATVNEFFSDFFVPYLQIQMAREIKSLVAPEVFSKIKFVQENFKGLFYNFSAEHRRFSLYAKQSAFVKSDKFHLGLAEFFSKETKNFNLKPVHAAKVSLPDMLKTVLEKPGIYQQMRDFRNQLLSDKSVITNIVQGEL